MNIWPRSEASRERVTVYNSIYIVYIVYIVYIYIYIYIVYDSITQLATGMSPDKDRG